METNSSTARKWITIISGILLLFGLYLTNLYNYLLFHSIAEVFIIVVSCGIFIVAWNSRRFLDNKFFLFIGIAYLFIAILELIHTLGYTGMGIFKGYGTDLPTQLWIAARYMESLSLFIAPLFFGRRVRLNVLFIVYASATCLIFLSIFLWNIFPVCFVEGTGLTPFKKISEYIICLILLGAIALLYQKRKEFEVGVYRLLVASIVLSIAAELTFTLYIHAYGFSNLVGHYFTIISFYLIYKAIIETGLVRPYDLMFRNLKQSEDMIRNERDRAQRYLDVAGVIIIVLNVDQTVALINKKGCEILGYDEPEIIGKKWLDNFIPERDRGSTGTTFFELLAGNIDPVKYYENYVLTKDNKERLIAWHNSILRDDDGKIIATLSSGEDITERKQAEGALRESEKFLEDVFNAIGDGISVLDLNLKIIRVNSWMEKMYSIEEGLAENMCYEVYQNRDTPCPWCPSLKTIETGEPHSATVPYPSEENPIGWIDLSSFPLNNAEGDLIGVIEYVKDITQRKRMQLELKEANDIINRSPVVAFLWKNDEVWPVEFVSENVKELFGYSAEDFTSGKVPYTAVVHPDDMERVTEEVSNFSKDVRTKEFVHEPYRIITKNHTVKYVDDRTYIRRDNKGEITHYEGVVIDITDRIRAEKSLKESHETFLTVLDGIDSTIYVADMETYEILFMNKRMKDNFGADFTGKICWEVFRHGSGPCGYCTNDKLLDEEGNPAGIQVWDDQDPITGKWHINYDRAVKWMDGRYVRLQVATDITEVKKMEEQLRQAQKMEAIGTLAGGVAHDFNNILTTIIGNASFALMNVGRDGTLREEIEDIKEAGERAAALTRQLLAFSRKQIVKPEILDLNELLTDIEKMLGRLIGEDVELLTIPGPELWQVETDPGQMEQVIMNLVINAKNAMPKGGKLTIETANMDLDENYFREHGIKEQPGPYVMLAVTDTGSGMDKETQKQIFDPFFTTKKRGEGTGLGLSTVYGIIKQNNGFIWVYSEPGQGSTFKVYLPKVKGDTKLEEKGQIPVENFGGSETVLVVEDDDSLRKLAKRALQQYGYRVLAAENGEEALRVSEAHEGTIELMITDVVMPKMSGKETAERLEPLYPQMKVIYMSGYTDNAIVHHGVLAPGLNFLEKPFTPDGLVRKVREVLDAENEY